MSYVINSKYLIMGRMLAAAWFTIFLLTEQTTVADQSWEAETVKIKAKVLGEKVGSKINERLPAPTQPITRGQAQAVSTGPVKSRLAMQSHVFTYYLLRSKSQ